METPPSSSLDFIRQLEQESGLTHSQLQIWTGQKVHADSPFCNMAFTFLIEGALDVHAFQKAWLSVVEQSDALRTSVSEVDGMPRRMTHEAALYATEYRDLSLQPQALSDFQSWSAQDCAKTMPLDGPLARSALFKLSDTRYGWYLNQHHLITDAAATILLFRKVSKAYEALSSDTLPSEESPLSYYDTAREAAIRASTATEEARRYWSERKGQRERRASLYGKSGDSTTTESDRIEIELSFDESDRIRSLSQTPEFASFFPETSVFAVFVTLLASLLKRITGQSSIGFDTPAGNRNTPDAKRSLGCFIEMFPFDIAIEDADDFRTLGARCTANIHDLLSHVAPRASSPDGAHASNVVLNFFPQSFGTFAGLSVRSDWIHSGHIDGVYDLKLQAHDYNGLGRYTLQLDLSASTFTAYDRERVQHHLRRMLDVMLENPEKPISAFDILSPAERARTVFEFNRSAATPPPSDGLLQRIQSVVQAHPDRVALRQGASTVSYAEMWKLTGNAANQLRSLGADKEQCVAVALPRSAEAVLAIIAVMRSGAAFVPIDPQYAPGRIAKILQNAAPICVIASDTGDSSTGELKRLAWIDLAHATPPADSLPRWPEPRDLAYVIYTSGSTGTPKGVEIEHTGLIDYLDWAERSYVRGERLCYPLFTSLSFDLTITSLFLPLMTGGELIVYPPSSAEADSAVIDVINDNAVDFIKLTPSHLALLRQLDLSNSRLSRLVLGGEDLKATLANSVVAQFKREIELYNEYGPTECVVGCMIHRFVPGQSARLGPSVPIGKPADHVALYLLNDSSQLVPEGVPGELYIERHGMARGYRNDPVKTAASFAASPFDSEKTLYRTGDLARFSDDGVMTFLGRIDSQIKVSGHRIELGEIEAALLEQEGITGAYVHASRSLAISEAPKDLAHCSRCGLASNFPNVFFDDEGVCGTCRSFESIKDEANAYFQASDALIEIFDRSRQDRHSRYDCMVFYSGGKDSTYALGKLVDLGYKVYAFTLDNGYISEQAKTNIRRVAKALGIDHEFASTPAMNAIFRDSLTRFSNVCNGCFKTIYTLGMARAQELGIPIIVTGLSRGQFFETRLTENLFKNGSFTPCHVDQAVLEARKAYHRMDDAVNQLLDTRHVQDDRIFEEIVFIDFYRYWDASLEEIYDYLARRLPWIRPADTGRSTNCLVNDVGIYIHKKERGFHNYALPYSWDVRLGHKKREEALAELDDQLDLGQIRRMLQEIGYDENRLAASRDRVQLVAYYTSDKEIDSTELQRRLATSLPAQMRPNHCIRLASIPLNQNGKVDTSKLPPPSSTEETRTADIEAPEGPVEERVFEVWASCLHTRQISRHDSFFQLGGASLDAMEVTLQLCRDFEIDIPLQTLFMHPTLAGLSQAIEAKIVDDIANLSDEEAESFLRS